MDYLWYGYSYAVERLAYVRRMIYYHYGYRHHELRVVNASRFVSPRLVAVKSNDIEAIRSNVLRGEWRVDDIVSVNNMTTMLHESVVMDRQEIFDFLMRQGADINCRDRNGYTPLLKAAALGRVHMLKRLLEAGVNPEQRDPYGNTPLQKARLHEEWEAAEILEQAKSTGKTPTKWLWGPDI